MFNAIPQGGVINFYENVPFDKEHSHVRDFLNEQERTAYFAEKQLISKDGVSYIRNGKCKVELPVAQLKYCNYCSFVNDGFDFKRYYAFITDIVYISNSTTEVTIEIDNFQTWLFQYDILPCWVEREHVLDDTVGLHTVSENIALGDMIAYEKSEKYYSNWKVMIQYAPNNFLSAIGFDGGSIINGIYSGASVEILPLNATILNDRIKELNTANQSIVNMYMIPDELDSPLYYEIFNTGLHPSKTLVYYDETYQIKNNKLLTYPYQFLRLYNGKSISDFAFEYFPPNSSSFIIQGTKMNAPRIFAYPDHYMQGAGIVVGGQNGMTMGQELNDFPLCTWGNNGLLQYLGLGGLTDTLSTLGNTLLGGVVGGPIGAIKESVTGVSGQIKNTLNDAFSSVRIKGGSSSGYVDKAHNHFGYLFLRMGLKVEVARTIDDYFTLYGYQVNLRKKPNLGGRTLFNYVKTLDASFSGNIPQSAIEDFEKWFNKGITIWHTEIGTEGDNDIE